MGIDLLDLLMRGKPVPIQPMLYLPLSISTSLYLCCRWLWISIWMSYIWILGWENWFKVNDFLCSLRYRNERRINTCRCRK